MKYDPVETPVNVGLALAGGFILGMFLNALGNADPTGYVQLWLVSGAWGLLVGTLAVSLANGKSRYDEF